MPAIVGDSRQLEGVFVHITIYASHIGESTSLSLDSAELREREGFASSPLWLARFRGLLSPPGRRRRYLRLHPG